MTALRFVVLSLSLGTVSALLSPPSVAHAEELPDVQVAAERLEGIFEKQAGMGEFGRYLHGVTGVALGGAGVGTGLWLMFDENAWTEVDRDHSLLTGGILLGMGTMALASGIFTLATPSFSAQRLERFRLAYADGLSEREVGLFEGELRLEAERGRIAREMSIVTGFAKVLGGGGIVLATAVADVTQGQEEFGYIAGSVVAGLGALMVVKSLLCRSHAEHVWEDYLRGETPEARAEVQVDVAPLVSATNAGVAVVGAF